ncbi:two component transcriptional regulator, LuxR family [Collimonas sp. OK307]|uniref:response regulator n=1 Tax=Collimonas sp. OK307 TaxID=1801620 RepID=UPI0008F1E6A1|nr:response regulator transcription factor [Collimonas sp. OK307]SFI32688.1 two component transcriptional regulator, LuxR family [Collimonas sp. OK307]
MQTILDRLPPVAPLRIMIADDHCVVRAGIASLLNDLGYVEIVGQASNGLEAVEQWRKHKPDITLMDLRMPEMGGVEAITQIRAEKRDALIVILTTFDGDEDVFRGMRAGAKGCLLKDTTPEELISCIRCVSFGRSYIPSSVAEKLANRLTGDALTAREAEILKHVADGEANKLIAYHLNIAPGTVKKYLTSILSKLDATSRTGAVSVARRRGLIES